jgi:putative membrane-bound dehydrogenase-like protein
VAEGFEVSLYADDALASNIFSLTLDRRGRPVVSGPGYIRTLHDDDGDGRADRTTTFADGPATGAQGLCFVGTDLYCTGDGALLRYRDADGDGRADDPPQRITALSNGEHGSHAIVHGPDGQLYVICGNNARVGLDHVTGDQSPIRDPRSGTVLRVTIPDGPIEVLAHGFRNPYDLAFLADGTMFTVDSDGERVHHLPWYEATRLFDVALGAEHGWLENGSRLSWSRPASFFDSMPRVAEFGRGSPTGLVTYRHRRFPPRYQGGLFHCCWTLGRIYFVPLKPSGASYVGHPEVFLQTVGDVGFAPVDAAVGPNGDLLVAIGGRSTRGSVFRITHQGAATANDNPTTNPASANPPGSAPAEVQTATPTELQTKAQTEAQPRTQPNAADTPLQPPAELLEQVLAAPQPLTAWSRNRWIPLARQLGAGPFRGALVDDSLDMELRLRAVEVLTELFDGVPLELADALRDLGETPLVARVAWSLGRHPRGPGTVSMLFGYTYVENPLVQRATWQALATLDNGAATPLIAPDWESALNASDRHVQNAVQLAARGALRARFEDSLGQFRHDWPLAQQLACLRHFGLRRDDLAAWPSEYWDAALRIATTADAPQQQLDALRLLQLGLGDVQLRPDEDNQPPGYQAVRLNQIDLPLREKAITALSEMFPSQHPEVNRELARLLGMLEADQPRLLSALAQAWTAESTVADDLHYLMVMSRLSGTRSPETTRRTAAALCRVQPKLAAEGGHPSRLWPQYLSGTFDRLRALDPNLAKAMVEDPAFGQAGHGLFALRMPEALQPLAARRLLKNAAQDEDQWSEELVTVLALLSREEVLPMLRAMCNEVSLWGAVLPLLAQDPRNEDRSRFVEALTSRDPEIVQQAATALVALEADSDPHARLAALRAMRGLCSWPVSEARRTAPKGEAFNSAPLRDSAAARRSVDALLAHYSGQQRAIQVETETPESIQKAYQAWFDWFALAHPQQAEQMNALGGNWEQWQQRLSAIDWDAGSSLRGKAVFEKQLCDRCHRGNQRLGPDLKGVTLRMQRDDLFSAIVDPSRDVSPAYQSLQVRTRDGKLYAGLIVYESPDGTLLQTGPGTSVRFTSGEIASRIAGGPSLMPSGLLDGLDSTQLADLYAYLKTLSP